MHRPTGLLALLGAALLALAIYVPVSSASAGTITTSYSVGVSCTAPFSEICNPPATVTVHTGGVLQADFFHPAECSPIAVNLIVDGVTEFTSPFLLNQGTGFIELGPVQPGSHVIGVQAIGTVAGCNFGALFSWGGTLTLVTTSLPMAKDECKNNGWASFGGFTNQGDCVSFLERH